MTPCATPCPDGLTAPASSFDVPERLRLATALGGETDEDGLYDDDELDDDLDEDEPDDDMLDDEELDDDEDDDLFDDEADDDEDEDEWGADSPDDEDKSEGYKSLGASTRKASEEDDRRPIDDGWDGLTGADFARIDDILGGDEGRDCPYCGSSGSLLGGSCTQCD